VPAVQQRARVLAAARQVFARVGLRAATIEEVAHRAGVTRQAVYELFGDKNALFHAVIIGLMDELDAEFGVPPERTAEMDDASWARTCFERALRYLHEHPDTGQLVREAVYSRDPMLAQIRVRITEVYAEALRRWFAKQGIELGRSADAVVAMGVGMAEALSSMRWPGERPDLRTQVELLTEFTVAGVFAVTEQAPELLSRLR
jgi:AcrR family transcriptional regulator